MIKKKIVMLGGFAVGKTSLVQRFVNSIFSEKYQTTIGVKIDQKKVDIDGTEVNMILWDIHGEDDFQKVKKTYIIGSSGYFLVADGTRKQTLSTAEYLHELAKSVGKDIPFILLINKSDLADEWEIENEVIEKYRESGWQVIMTSAKTGYKVEDAFLDLARKMIAK